MKFTLKSTKYGKQEFRASETNGFAYLLHKENDIWRQVCEGGSYTGPTAMVRGNMESLKSGARKWWKQYLRAMREASSLYGCN